MAKKETAVSNEKIIAALMNSSTLAQAAQAAGVSSRGLYDRMTDQQFRAEYQAAKAAVLREAVNNLNSRIGAAISTIAGIMEDTEANPAIRLQAAQTILNTAAKFTERLDKADAAALDARRVSFDIFAA